MQTNDLTNREFGDYHILRKIGGGAMADVYLAEQRSLGRRVAVKILKPDLAHDETYIRRFVREARAIAALTHPNLVQIFQADCLDGYWFIAQEYVQGQTLQQLIQKSGPVPFRRVADILWDISSALEKASQTGIVHRDIKPDNILLGDNGEVKLADFGLARVNSGNGTTPGSGMTLTQIGMTLGTPLYMSPEQAQGKTLDGRSDMYSLGVTCYHALAGQPPFRGETPLSVALMHVNEQPEPLEKYRPDVPPPLVRLVHRMLEKTPEKRFASFYDLQLELRGLYTVYLNDADAASRLTGWNQMAMSRSDEQLLLATEKLQRVMKQESRLGGRRRSAFFQAFVVTAILFSGMALGYWRTSSLPSSLHEPTSSIITKRESVEEQWVYACILDTVDGWQAVIDYFPEQSYFWGRKAKRQMIRCYFHDTYGSQGSTIHSQPIFQEFAELSDLDAEDQALGLAGLAWCAAERNNTDAALDYLRRLYETEFSYSDELLIQILDAANKAIQRRNKEPETKQEGR